jgi:phosphoribosylformimino-5-aminoimidazole carboxamide ribotide isomerase
MLIIPAIDLQEGYCVRLKQGQFNELTQFDVSPIERARYFSELGAQRLHVVDLDGARTGTMHQLPLIKAMQECGITVQAGGGIRTLEQAERCFAAGIKKIVLGSIAITNKLLTQQISTTFGAEHIILALDVHIKNTIPVPATHGWQTSSEDNLWDIVSYYQAIGIDTVLCTDISCDGMMNGPNFFLYQQAVNYFPDINWQASGGIRDEEDLQRLDNLGVAGAILGLTLYQGHFDLARCLASQINNPTNKDCNYAN